MRFYFFCYIYVDNLSYASLLSNLKHIIDPYLYVFIQIISIRNSEFILFSNFTSIFVKLSTCLSERWGFRRAWGKCLDSDRADSLFDIRKELAGFILKLGQKGVFRDIISSEGFLKICDQLKIPFLNFEC